MCPVRDVNPDIISFLDEFVPPLGAHAVEHLELEAPRVNTCFPSDMDRGLDAGVVMGCDAGIVAAQDKRFGELIVVEIDFFLILKGYIRRFFLSPFAQPDFSPGLDQPFNIRLAPAQIGLDYDADVLPCLEYFIKKI